MKRTRYALVEAGSRSGMYLSAIFDTYKDTAERVALCDSNISRMPTKVADLVSW